MWIYPDTVVKCSSRRGAGWSIWSTGSSIEVTGKFPALCLHSTTRETMEPLEPEPEPALGGAAGTSDANGSAGDKELLGAIRTLFDAMDSDQDGVSDLGRQRPVGCLARSPRLCSLAPL